ncbi:hypothetical protein VSDG_06166 [Cytospora chrysosperma]|uniref:Uncharacterized protein n=1 Tax=Cytospora chrysosperma TaxID=252740 RepID=A0A423VUG3_CYTCH|nr:hypothetical protein VSDG_06166 [Valsa sordida]
MRKVPQLQDTHIAMVNAKSLGGLRQNIVTRLIAHEPSQGLDRLPGRKAEEETRQEGSTGNAGGVNA